MSEPKPSEAAWDSAKDILAGQNALPEPNAAEYEAEVGWSADRVQRAIDHATADRDREIEELVEALNRYSTHDATCAAEYGNEGCTCGLAVLLNRHIYDQEKCERLEAELHHARDAMAKAQQEEARLDAKLKEAEAELERLRALEARLPKCWRLSKNGRLQQDRAAYPGMEVAYICPETDEIIEATIARLGILGSAAQKCNLIVGPESTTRQIPIDCVYETPQAAQQARQEVPRED